MKIWISVGGVHLFRRRGAIRGSCCFDGDGESPNSSRSDCINFFLFRNLKPFSLRSCPLAAGRVQSSFRKDLEMTSFKVELFDRFIMMIYICS